MSGAMRLEGSRGSDKVVLHEGDCRPPTTG